MSEERTWFPLTGASPGPRGAVLAAPKKKSPIDPLTGPKLALAGRVITMNDTFAINPNSVVYIEKGVIAAVQPGAKPAPAGFDAASDAMTFTKYRPLGTVVVSQTRMESDTSRRSTFQVGSPSRR